MPGSLKQKNVIRLFTFSKYIIMLNGTQEQFQSSEVVVKAEVILHCSSVCFIFAACMCFIKLSAENVYILRKESISKKMFLHGNQVFILLNSSFNISYKFIQINNLLLSHHPSGIPFTYQKEALCSTLCNVLLWMTTAICFCYIWKC